METTDFEELAAPASFMRPFIQEGRYTCYENAACEFDDEEEDENAGGAGGVGVTSRHVVMDGYEGDGDNDSDEYGEGCERSSYAYHDNYGGGEERDGDVGAVEDYSAMYGDFSVQELHEFMLQQQQQSMLDYAYSLRRYSLLETIHEETYEELRSDSECRSEVSDSYSGVWCWGDDFTDGAESVIYVENPAVTDEGHPSGSCNAADSDLRDRQSEETPVIAKTPVQDPSEREGTWLDAESEDTIQHNSSTNQSGQQTQHRSVALQAKHKTQAMPTTVQTTVEQLQTDDKQQSSESFEVDDSATDSRRQLLQTDPTSSGSTTPAGAAGVLSPQMVAQPGANQTSTAVSRAAVYSYLKSAADTEDGEIDAPTYHAIVQRRQAAVHQRSQVDADSDLLIVFENDVDEDPTMGPLQSKQERQFDDQLENRRVQNSEVLTWSDAIDAYLMSLAVHQEEEDPAHSNADVSASDGDCRPKWDDKVSKTATVQKCHGTAASSNGNRQGNGLDGYSDAVPVEESRDVSSSAARSRRWRRSAGVGSETAGSNDEIAGGVEGKSCQGSTIPGNDLHAFDCRKQAAASLSSSLPNLQKLGCTAIGGDDDNGAPFKVKAAVPVRESSSSFLDEDESLVEFVGLENLVRTAGDGAEEQELFRACTRFLNGEHGRYNDDNLLSSGYDHLQEKQMQQQHRLSGIKSAPDLHNLDDDDAGHHQDFRFNENLKFSTNSVEDYALKSQSEPCVCVGQTSDEDDRATDDGARNTTGTQFAAFGGGDLFCPASTPLKRHSYAFGLSSDLSSCRLDCGNFSKSFDSQFSNDNSYHRGSSSSGGNCSSEEEEGSVNSYDGSDNLSRSRASLSLFPRFTPPGTLRSFRSFDTLNLAGKIDDGGCNESLRSSSGHLTTGQSWMDGIDEECSSEREEKARPSSENLSEDSGFCDLRSGAGQPLPGHPEHLPHSEAPNDGLSPEEDDKSILTSTKTHDSLHILSVLRTEHPHVYESVGKDPKIYSGEPNGDCQLLRFAPAIQQTLVENLDRVKEPMVEEAEQDVDLSGARSQNNPLKNSSFHKSVDSSAPSSRNTNDEIASEEWKPGECRTPKVGFETGSEPHDGNRVEVVSCLESATVEGRKEEGRKGANSPAPGQPLQTCAPLSAASCLLQNERPHPIRGDRLLQTSASTGKSSSTDGSPTGGVGMISDGDGQPLPKNEDDQILQRIPEPLPDAEMDNCTSNSLAVPVIESTVAATIDRKASIVPTGREADCTSQANPIRVPVRDEQYAGETIVLSISEGHQIDDAKVRGSTASYGSQPQSDLRDLPTLDDEQPSSDSITDVSVSGSCSSSSSTVLSGTPAIGDYEDEGKEVRRLPSFDPDSGVAGGVPMNRMSLDVTTITTTVSVGSVPTEEEVDEVDFDYDAGIQSGITLSGLSDWDKATDSSETSISRTAAINETKNITDLSSSKSLSASVEEFTAIESSIEACLESNRLHTEFELQQASDYVYLESNISIGDSGAADNVSDFARPGTPRTTNVRLDYRAVGGEYDTTTTIVVTSTDKDFRHEFCLANEAEAGLEVNDSVRVQVEVQQSVGSNPADRQTERGPDLNLARPEQGLGVGLQEDEEEEEEVQGGVHSQQLLKGEVISEEITITTTTTTSPPRATATTPETEATACGTSCLVEVDEEEEEVRQRHGSLENLHQKSPCSRDGREELLHQTSPATRAALNRSRTTVYSAFTHELLKPSRDGEIAITTERQKQQQWQTFLEGEENLQEEPNFNGNVQPLQSNLNVEEAEEEVALAVSGTNNADAVESDCEFIKPELVGRCGKIPTTAVRVHIQTPFDRALESFSAATNDNQADDQCKLQIVKSEYQSNDDLQPRVVRMSSGSERQSSVDAEGHRRSQAAKVVTFREDDVREPDPEMEKTGRRQLWWPYALESASAVGLYTTGKPTDITTLSDKSRSLVRGNCHRGDVPGQRQHSSVQVWEDEDEWFGSSIDDDAATTEEVQQVHVEAKQQTSRPEQWEEGGGDLQPLSASLVAEITRTSCNGKKSEGRGARDDPQLSTPRTIAPENRDKDTVIRLYEKRMSKDYKTPGKPPLPPHRPPHHVTSPRHVAACRSKIINARQHFFTSSKGALGANPPDDTSAEVGHVPTSSDDETRSSSLSNPQSSRSTTDDDVDSNQQQQQHHADVAEVLERFRQRAQEGRERIAKTVLDLSEVERAVRIQQQLQRQQNWDIDSCRDDNESELAREIRNRSSYGGTDVEYGNVRLIGNGGEYRNGFNDDNERVQSPSTEDHRHPFQDVYRHVTDVEEPHPSGRRSHVNSQEQRLDSSDSDAPSHRHRPHRHSRRHHDNRPTSPEASLVSGGSASSSPPATDARHSAAYSSGRRRSSGTSWRGSNQSVGYLETDIDTLHSREVIRFPDNPEDVDDDDDKSSRNGLYGFGLGSVRRHYPFKLKTQSMFNLAATDAAAKNTTSNLLGVGGDALIAHSHPESGHPDDASRAKSMEFLLKDENKAAVLPPENRLQQAAGVAGGVQLRTKHGDRVLSEHELRIRRSLQKLNLPEWYTSSPISQMGSTEGFILRKDQSEVDAKRASTPRWEDIRSTSSSNLGGSAAFRSSTPGSSGKNVVISKRVTTPDFRYVKSSRESLLQSPMSPSPSPSPKDKSSYFQYCSSYTPSSALSRWSSSRFSSTTASSRSTSPTGSLQYRSSFQRQPYLGWRSSERLAREMTNSTAGDDSASSTPTHGNFYRSAAERLSQGPGYYAYRFGLYRAPGSDTNLVHRNGRRGSDVSTATAPPYTHHTGSGDSAIAASVIGEPKAYGSGGHPEIMVNVIEPDGCDEGVAGRGGRPSSPGSEQMQVADLVREIDKLIHRNGQVVENGDASVLQQQEDRQQRRTFQCSNVPLPELAPDLAAEQRFQEASVQDEARTSPTTSARQKAVWMESSFVGVRPVPTASTPSSESSSVMSGNLAKDGTPKPRLDSDASPVSAQPQAATTSHVQVHPPPPALFQTPSLHNKESIERRLSLNSTTMEEVLDSLLALPSSSQSPSPSGFRPSKWETSEEVDVGNAVQKGPSPQPTTGDLNESDKPVPSEEPKAESAALPTKPVQSQRKTASSFQRADSGSADRKASSGTGSSSGSEVNSNRSSLASSGHGHNQDRDEGSSGTDLTTASTTVDSGSSSYRMSDSCASTGDSMSVSGHSHSSSVSPSSSGSGKEVIPPPPDFTDRPLEVFYVAAAAAPSAPLQAAPDPLCTASFTSGNAPGNDPSQSDTDRLLSTCAAHRTSGSFAPEEDTSSSSMNLCTALAANESMDGNGSTSPPVVPQEDTFPMPPTAEQFQEMQQLSCKSPIALRAYDSFSDVDTYAPPPPQSDCSFETDYPETSTFTGASDSFVLDSSVDSSGYAVELARSTCLMSAANDVFNSIDDDDEDSGSGGIAHTGTTHSGLQQFPDKPLSSSVHENHSIARDVSLVTNISQGKSSDDDEDGVTYRRSKTKDVVSVEGEKRRTLRSDTLDDTVIVRCSHDQCKNTAELWDARKNFKTCHNCYTYYCSRECRKDHWLRHRRVCMYGRIRSMCKQAIQCSRENASCLLYLSKLARTGYITQGRGYVKIVFRNTDLAIRFLRQGWPQLEDSPIYVNWRDLIPQEMGDEVYRSVVDLCQRYDPDVKFVLLVAIFITREVPIQSVPHWEREVIAKCAKVGLSKFVGKDGYGFLDEDPNTMILTGPPHVTGADVAALRKGREVCLVNIQEQLRERGVSLRQQFPDAYARLCSYVDNDDPFPPLTIYPKDGRTGQNFMCVITPNSGPLQSQDSIKSNAK